MLPARIPESNSTILSLVIIGSPVSFAIISEVSIARLYGLDTILLPVDSSSIFWLTTSLMSIFPLSVRPKLVVFP